MKKILFQKGIEFESNSYYFYRGDRIDYFKEDCTALDDDRYFCSTNKYSNYHYAAIYLHDLENVVIDFNGATLFLNGALAPIIMRNCKNVEIKNIVVEFDRAFHTQMTVKEKGKGYIKCEVDKRFPYRIEDGKFIPYGKYWEDTTLHQSYIFLQEFDSKTRRGINWPVVLIGNKDLDSIKLPWGDDSACLLASEEDGLLVLKGKNIPEYQVGSYLILCMNNRDIATSTMVECKDLKITNFRIINGVGMGLMPIYCENITIDGYKLFYDDKSVGIISNTADGIHAVSLKGKFELKNSIITGTIDDALNIHSNFYGVKNIEGNILHATTLGQSDNFVIFHEGDELAVYKDHTMEEIDRAKIMKINHIKGQKEYDFILDKKIKNAPENSLIENMSTQVEVHINNCEFGKSNTHLRFQTRGKVLIENSKTEMDLIFTGDTNFWFESSPVNDVTIRNVEFDTDRYGIASIPEFKASEKEPFYHKNVTVENCKFSCNLGIYARFTDNIKFFNNTNKNNENFKIFLDNCGIFSGDNVIVERVNQRGSRDE